MSTEETGPDKFREAPVNVRVKLAALWTTVTLCYLYGDYFELYVPQKAAGLVSGGNLLNSPIKLLAASVLLAIPALMVFLSVVLKARRSRMLNLVSGVLFTAIMLLIAATSFTPWRAFYVFLALTESMITSLIVCYAWKWERNSA